MEALKKQHFPAFSQKFYFALVRINSQKFAHLKKWKKKYNFWIFLEGASSTLNNVLSMLNNVLSTLNNVLSTVCPWFVHGLIFWNIKVTNSYSAQVFPSIFNCGDLYCNCGHLSSRPGRDAKKRPLWVKKHPFYEGCLRNVRGSLGEGFHWKPGCNALLLSFERAKASLAQGFLLLGATKMTKTTSPPKWSESWNRPIWNPSKNVWENLQKSAISEATDAQLEGVSEPEQFLSLFIFGEGRCLKSFEMTSFFYLHFWQFWFVYIISMYRKKMTNDPWIHQSINPADWGVSWIFMASQQKMGCGLSGYGTCMRAAGRLEDWPCAIFLLQEMQVHSWMTGIQAQVLQTCAKTKKVQSQILLWITNSTYCKSVSYLDRIGFEEIIQVCNETIQQMCFSSICDIRWWLCCQAL